MRIVQAGVEVAGQVGLTAFGQREVGADAVAWFRPHPFGYDPGPDISPRGGTAVAQALSALGDAWRLSGERDVFHFHFGQSFAPDPLLNADVRLLRRRMGEVWAEFWGSEARLPSIEGERNPWYVNGYDEDDAANRRRLARWSRLTGGRCFAPDRYFDPMLAPYFDQIVHVAQRVDVHRFAPRPPDPSRTRPLVVHAPSQKAFKGTRYVDRSIEELRSRGAVFDYREVTGLSHRVAAAVYAEADLIIDQLCGGSHGAFAVEAMAMAKPVLCYILPGLEYPDGFPIVGVDPNTLTAVMGDWIADGDARHRRGLESRAYAERVHDCRVVAEQLLAAY